MKRIIAALALGILAGCATTPGGDVTPADALYQTKQAFAVAQSAARVYTSLPLCGTPSAIKACAERKIVIQIDEANIAAVKAIDAADAAIAAGQSNAMVLLNAAAAATASLASRTPAVKP